MSAKRIAGRVWDTYRFIEAHQKQHSVEMMCRVLGVARSGYYEWLREPVSKRSQEDARLLRLIRASFTASHGIYGAPRVFLDLREAGETCSKHRVTRFMRENGLRALHGYRTRRVSIGKPSVLIPNLLQRQFTVTRPNKAWVTDITYIRTWQGRLLPGSGDGSVLPQDLRLVDESDDPSRARSRCRSNRGPTPSSDEHIDSFGSGHAIRKRCLEALLQVEPSRTKHEPQRELLGQCGRRIVLRKLEERTDQEAHLQGPRSCERGHR